MSESLKDKTISGLIWNLFERFSYQLVMFVVGVVLARLLSPADYGLVAMSSIFVGVSQVLVDSGFSSALIQKNDRTELDYSTVFVTNIVMSSVLCLILCAISPFIAEFYKEPLLKWIVVFCGVKIFLSSFIAVQSTRLLVNLEFKTRSRISIINSVISAVVSISMAFAGFGVWSLVVPEVFTIFASAIMFWHTQHWLPRFKFSKDSFRQLFTFGSKLLGSSIIEIIYGNIYTIVIGKKFSSTLLGYYSKGQGIANLPSSILMGTIANVSYPILSKIQTDNARLADAYRRMIRLAAFVIFPLMIGLAVLAKPLIEVLLTSKWANAAIYLQILCLSLMWYPIHSLNLNLLEVKGRSDLFLRLQIIKKVLGILFLIVSIPFGVVGMCWGQVLYSLVSLFVNTYYTGQLIGVGLFRQVLDFVPSMCYSALMGLLVYLGMTLVHGALLQLLLGAIIGFFTYLLMSCLTRSTDLSYVIAIVKEKMA